MGQFYNEFGQLTEDGAAIYNKLKDVLETTFEEYHAKFPLEFKCVVEDAVTSVCLVKNMESMLRSIKKPEESIDEI